MSFAGELVAPIAARWVREQARQLLKGGTHPVWAAYRACAGSAFDVYRRSFERRKDGQRGARWRSSPG